MKEYNLMEGSLYSYTAGTFSGVLVRENVMKKLAGLQAKHLEDVKRLLIDNIEDLYSDEWTLHYPEGVQTTVHFTNPSVDVARRIVSSTCSQPPRHLPVVFLAKSMKEAEAMADARHTLMSGD